MKLIFVFLFLQMCMIVNTKDCEINKNDKYYSVFGDVYVVGFFDAHCGKNCSKLNPLAFQTMYDVAAVVSVLNKMNYIPGISIGLSLYDTCSSKEIAIKSFISSLMDADCNCTYNLGVLSTDFAYGLIENAAKVKNIPIFKLDYNPDADILLDISVQLLLELEYNSVDLTIFPDSRSSHNFNNLTKSKNICVKQSITFSQYNGQCPGNDQLVILAVTSSELSFLLKLEMDCLSTFVIIILENNISLSSITERLLLHDAFLVISPHIWPEFDISVEENFESIVSVIEDKIFHSNVTMDFIRTASKTITVIDYFKYKLDTECGDVTLCSNLTYFKKSDETLISQGVQNVSQLLGIDNNNITQYLILRIQFNLAELFGKVRVGSNDVVIDFTNPLIHDKVNACDLDPENYKNCSNFAQYYDTNDKILRFFDNVPFKLKSSSWVSSILTICIIGVISSFSVLAFIIMRICKEDILEGNPCSTFLLLIATILTYLNVIPFCLEIPEKKMLCAAKLFGTSFCYCFIFSVILSRVLMILTCDYNGSFMSHINGYLQSFLCFFMFAVQVALIAEFWIFGWILSEIDYCVKFMNNNLFLSYVMYDTFLLVLIAAVVPFITKSRRNYKEGLSFTVVTAWFIIIWIVWTFGYFVASFKWKDFWVAAGLTGTASAVVICVFIPRTYLIATGIVRDRITSAIPLSTSNIVDMNYRSTQALYDSVTLERSKKGEFNMGYYDDPHASSAISRVSFHEERQSSETIPSVENNYESCDISNAAQTITKF